MDGETLMKAVDAAGRAFQEVMTPGPELNTPQPTAPEPSGCEVRFKFKPGDTVEFADIHRKILRATVIRMAIDNHYHKTIRVAWRYNDDEGAVWVAEGYARLAE